MRRKLAYRLRRGGVAITGSVRYGKLEQEPEQGPHRPLDEQLEAEIYGMLVEVLANTTIVSIGHRSTLMALHQRYIEMMPSPDSVFEPLPRIGKLGKRSAMSRI